MIGLLTIALNQTTYLTDLYLRDLLQQDVNYTRFSGSIESYRAKMTEDDKCDSTDPKIVMIRFNLLQGYGYVTPIQHRVGIMVNERGLLAITLRDLNKKEVFIKLYFILQITGVWNSVNNEPLSKQLVC